MIRRALPFGPAHVVAISDRALEVVDLPASVDDVIATDNLGWILIIVGALAIVLALVMNAQRSRTTPRVVGQTSACTVTVGDGGSPGTGSDWQQLIEMCRVVDTVLIDQETVYAPRQGNDRLLLGLKGSLNEYELDLLRQRSLEARRAMAKRGETKGIASLCIGGGEATAVAVELV